MSVREGTELQFPQPLKRFLGQPHNQDPTPPDPTQVQRSIEEDFALTVRARREQLENIAEQGRISNARSRFELTRDQVVFGVKLCVTAVSMGALAISAATDVTLPAVLISGVGVIGGVVSLMFRPTSQ